MPSGFVTEPIGAGDPESGFTCGVQELDDFFRQHALANHLVGIGRTYLWRSPPDAAGRRRVLGFYTISMCAVDTSKLPASIRARLPRYPMPVALIGRLAVAADLKGQGMGPKLLVDAFMRIAAVADGIGCFGVIVDAKDEGARAFYAKHGLVSIEQPNTFPHRMFISIDTVRAALQPPAPAP